MRRASVTGRLHGRPGQPNSVETSCAAPSLNLLLFINTRTKGEQRATENESTRMNGWKEGKGSGTLERNHGRIYPTQFRLLFTGREQSGAQKLWTLHTSLMSECKVRKAETLFRCYCYCLYHSRCIFFKKHCQLTLSPG